MALLNFLGAARQVTGSCYLIETHDKKQILLECGMQQGGHHELDNENGNGNGQGNRSPFAFNPEHLDAVVISHAHIDHSGLLPRLAAEGYRGPIYATEATSDLLEVMLMDAAHIQEKDAEWENRWRARRGKRAIAPIYVSLDAQRALGQRRPVGYDQSIQILPGVELKFHDAGHIIGSAIVELTFKEPNNSTRKLVFSGDLGMVGQTALFDLLQKKGIDITAQHMDCGIEIYDESQDAHSGGSGCGCAAVTLAALILKKLKEGSYKRVLFVPTGALLSKVSFNEGKSIPGVAHAVEFAG